MIEFPGMLFSSQEARSPFVIPVLDDDDVWTHPFRHYRARAFESFLVVDRTGRRLMGAASGIQKLDYRLAFKFGVVPGVLAAILETITLDPPVRLRARLEEDGTESLDVTRDRIYQYLDLNPPFYTWAGVRSLRGRVAKARTMEELVGRFVQD